MEVQINEVHSPLSSGLSVFHDEIKDVTDSILKHDKNDGELKKLTDKIKDYLNDLNDLVSQGGDIPTEKDFVVLNDIEAFTSKIGKHINTIKTKPVETKEIETKEIKAKPAESSDIAIETDDDIDADDIKIEDIEVKKVTKKGSALLIYRDKQAWILPRQYKKFQEGKLTPGIIQSIINGDAIKKIEDLPKKKPYRDVRALLRGETDKAYFIRTYNGGEHTIPKSQVYSFDGDDEWFIADWIVQQKDIQAKQKVFWK